MATTVTPRKRGTPLTKSATPKIRATYDPKPRTLVARGPYNKNRPENYTEGENCITFFTHPDSHHLSFTIVFTDYSETFFGIPYSVKDQRK